MGGRFGNVKLLLDTHAFVWAVADPARLSKAASEAIRSSGNDVFPSSAVAWELATKHRIGRFPEAKPIIDDLESLAEDLVARHLAITHDHAVRAGLMAVEHRDPFDRMLAAQAQIEGLHLVTRDPVFRAFDVDLMW